MPRVSRRAVASAGPAWRSDCTLESDGKDLLSTATSGALRAAIAPHCRARMVPQCEGWECLGIGE